jgi:hypothetical protein
MRIHFRKESRDPMASPNIRRTGAQAPRLGASHTVQQAVVAFAIVALAMTPGPAQAQDTLAASPDPCFFQSTMYGNGTTSCQDGLQFRCTGGAWLALGLACSGETIATARSCWLDGAEFGSGEPGCRDGLQLRCDDGVWKGDGTPCGAPPAPVQVSSSGASCRYEAITVSTGSSVCQMGTTYLCNDGQWVNMGTMCR